MKYAHMVQWTSSIWTGYKNCEKISTTAMAGREDVSIVKAPRQKMDLGIVRCDYDEPNRHVPFIQRRQLLIFSLRLWSQIKGIMNIDNDPLPN